MANPYQVLNIHPEASDEQIEEAYYKMRRVVSYGRAMGAVSEETLNTAYAILRDPIRRARLDKALKKRRDEREEARPSLYQKLNRLIGN